MRIKRFILGLLLALFTPAGLAFGEQVIEVHADAPPPDDLFAQMFSAVTSSNWKHVGALALMLFVWALRAHLFDRLGKVGAWLQTDRGGVASVLLAGALGAVSSAILAGKPIDASLLGNALQMSLEAAGGWVALRRLLRPRDAAPADAAAPGAAP